MSGTRAIEGASEQRTYNAGVSNTSTVNTSTANTRTLERLERL